MTRESKKKDTIVEGQLEVKKKWMAGNQLTRKRGIFVNDEEKNRVMKMQEKERKMQEKEKKKERVLKIELGCRDKQIINILVLHGLDEIEKTKLKDEFWIEVSQIVEGMRGKIMILDDLNERVGKRKNEAEEVIGQFGKEVRNNNGRRIIDFCMQEQLSSDEYVFSA
ncbi:hypothetical protein MML48_3g00011867 [Holotrichia oblita]|uniref:Uncharacterized protein n=1 Tax=Holotrichia oblita TaxID=644536 RepID=A0ACB9TDV2_HOLOL|nr:hypothetical protein MML48_3g00011867 [Holotrichia oblita]